jgi:hypothetical protein
MGFLNKISKLFGHLRDSYPFLLFANILIIGSLLSWLLLTNLYLSSHQEKVIRHEWAELVDALPKKSNASAIELESLLARLGLGTNSLSEVSPKVEAVKQGNSSAWQMITENINDYISTQEQKADDDIDPIPDRLKNYLAQHDNQIKLIVNHLNSSELPVWGITYLSKDKLPDFSIALPSFLNLVNFQRLLILSAINQSQVGQYESAMNTLSASLKFATALAQRPELISQLVAVIGINTHSKNIIKLDHLNSAWADSIRIPNFQNSMATSLKPEAFSHVGTFSEDTISSLTSIFTEDEDDPFTAPFETLQQLFQKPFFRLASINSFWEMVQFIEKIKSIPPQEFCTLDNNLNALRINSIPWNPLIQSYQPYFNQFFKSNKALLRWELAKKIIQIKEKTLQVGNLPNYIPGIEISQACPELLWDYRVTYDGEMSISLSQVPEWLEISENELPLSYSLRIEDIK